MGSAPAAGTLACELPQKDFLVYCGHGTSDQYFKGDELNKFTCKAVALLMGCSSGRLKHNGEYDASGMVYRYLCAGSPGETAESSYFQLKFIPLICSNCGQSLGCDGWRY